MNTAWDDFTAKKFRASALTVSSIIAVLAMLQSAGWTLDEGGTFAFMIWVVSPYLGLLLIDTAIRRVETKRSSLVLAAASFVMLGFTIVAYVLTLGDESSTYGLIFLFVPFFLHVGGAMFLVVGLAWAFLSKPHIK